MEGVFITEKYDCERIYSECVFQRIKSNKRERHLIKYRTKINVDNISIYKNVRLIIHYESIKSVFKLVYLSEGKMSYVIETLKKYTDRTIRVASQVDNGTLEYIIITIHQ